MKSTHLKNYLGSHLFLICFGLVMTYPIIWLFFAGLKTNDEIFYSAALLPKSFHWENFQKGWEVINGFSFFHFFGNSLLLVTGTLLGTLVSSSLVGYGFARLNFKFKQFLFSILIATLLLPNVITLIPRYVMFTKLNWVNSFMAFWVPSLLGTGISGAFFIFLMVQFIRGIPQELDESARIDGCSTFGIFRRIILPLSKPVLSTIGIFTFLWSWDDFQNQLILLNRVNKFTVALALRMTIDTADMVDWGPILAMSLVTLLPSIILFFLAQKYVIEGMSATSGLKG